MLRRDSPTPREHMSERLWMRDRMALLHSVCHHHEFVKTSHRGSHETCSPQVLTEPSSLEVGFQRTFGKFASVLPEFEKINSAADWDYQRSKVYVRTNKTIRRSVEKSQKTDKHVA